MLSWSSVSLPEPKIQRNQNSSTWNHLKKIAEDLFKKGNLKSDSMISFATNPLILFCKESKHSSFDGVNVNGFQTKFCNNTKMIQTDVGTCVASNPRYYINEGNILQNTKVNNNSRMFKDIQQVLILNVNKYGQLGFNVCITMFSCQY